MSLPPDLLPLLGLPQVYRLTPAWRQQWKPLVMEGLRRGRETIAVLRALEQTPAPGVSARGPYKGYSLVLSRDGRRALVNGSHSYSWRDVETNTEILQCQGETIWGSYMSPDGDTVVLVARSHILVGHQRTWVRVETDAVHDVIFTSKKSAYIRADDGCWFAPDLLDRRTWAPTRAWTGSAYAGGDVFMVRVTGSVEVRRGETVLTLPTRGSVLFSSLSDNGLYAALLWQDGVVTLYDTRTGAVLLTTSDTARRARMPILIVSDQGTTAYVSLLPGPTTRVDRHGGTRTLDLGVKLCGAAFQGEDLVLKVQGATMNAVWLLTLS